ADVEGALPFAAFMREHAAAAADAGVVEQEMDPVGVLLTGDLIGEALDVLLVGDVGQMGGDAQPLRQPFELAQPLGLGHRGGRHAAHGDVAALGHELARELAAHAGAASGDDRNSAGEILHATLLPRRPEATEKHGILVAQCFSKHSFLWARSIRACGRRKRRSIFRRSAAMRGSWKRSATTGWSSRRPRTIPSCYWPWPPGPPPASCSVLLSPLLFRAARR